MRISDWSSDVCSSDLLVGASDAETQRGTGGGGFELFDRAPALGHPGDASAGAGALLLLAGRARLRQQLAVVLARGEQAVAEVGRQGDRKSVVQGKGVSVRVDLGGRRIIQKTKQMIKATDNSIK